MVKKHYKKFALVVSLIFVCGGIFMAFSVFVSDSEKIRREATEDLVGASIRTNAGEITRLIQRGADVNAVNLGMTPLMLAARHNTSPDVVRALVQGGADIHATYEGDMSRWTVFVRLIAIENNVDDIFFSRSGWTSSMFAATFNQNTEILRALIENGADASVVDNNGYSLLMLAAKGNFNPEILRVLIENGADVNAADPWGRTSLMLATAFNSNPEILQTLIEEGADINAADARGETPMAVAVSRRRPEFVRVLSESSADVSRGSLVHAIIHQNEEIVRALAKSGADINDICLVWAIEHNLYRRLNPRVAQVMSIEDNTLEIIRALIEGGVDVNAPDANGRTPLEAAISRGDHEIVRILLEGGADVNVPDARGSTLLRAAASRRNTEIARLLIAGGADVNMPYARGGTPLGAAVFSGGTPEMVQLLIDSGADVSVAPLALVIRAIRRIPSPNSIIEILRVLIENGADVNYAATLPNTGIWLGASRDYRPPTPETLTPLRAAISVGSPEAVLLLLENGADISAVSERVFSEIASLLPCPDVLQILIDNGADVNAVGSRGRVPLMAAAAQNSNPDVLRVLINNGADINVVGNNGTTLLMSAASQSPNPDILRFLIENGADVNAVNNDGATSLMLAAVRNSNPDVLRVLIENGAGVNIVGNNGGTLLAIAANLNPNYDALRVLIENGVDVNIADNDGVTPLMRAARRHRSNFVRILLENGADVNVTDERGRTALIHAAYAGGARQHYDVVRALLEHGADVNVANNYGRTSLMSAVALRSSTRILRALIANGADVNAADNIGMTPLMHAAAATATYPHSLQFLIEHGADVNAVDNHGRTSMMILTYAEFFAGRGVQALIRHGADINAADNEGVTSLMRAAARNSNPVFLQIFIENGADINAVDSEGMTPLMHAAARNSNSEILQILLENGAVLTIKDNEGKLALNHAEGNVRLKARRTVRVAGGVDLNLFHPWDRAIQLTRLDSPASLRINSNFPVLDGATSAYPIFAAVANEVFDVNRKEELRQYLSVSRTAEAYNRLIRGEVDMIFVLQPSDEQLKVAEEAGVELRFTPIARDGFVFFVNSRNPVSGLSIEQIRDIYRNNITNWHEVGGNDKIILPIQRPANSGSQTAMINEVMQGEELLSPPMEWVEGFMSAAVQAVAQYRNQEEAIGYSFRFFTEEMMRDVWGGRQRQVNFFQLMIDLIPADAPDASERRERYLREIHRIMNPIQLLAIDGVYPSKENIRNGTYPFTVDVFAVTAGTSNPHVQDIIDWLLSPQGQELIEKTGYVGVGGM